MAIRGAGGRPRAGARAGASFLQTDGSARRVICSAPLRPHLGLQRRGRQGGGGGAGGLSGAQRWARGYCPDVVRPRRGPARWARPPSSLPVPKTPIIRLCARRSVPSACSHRAGRGAGGVSAGAGARAGSGRPSATPEGGAAGRSRPWAVRWAGASVPPRRTFAVGRAAGEWALGDEVSLWAEVGGRHRRGPLGRHPHWGRAGAGEPPHRVYRRGRCPRLACSYFQVCVHDSRWGTSPK